MAKRIRNHRLEYKRRIARARALGLSTSQARGHARAGERKKPYKSSKEANPALERALTRMKNGETQRSAAASESVTVEQLRRYVKENTRAKLRGRKWIILDRRPINMLIASRGILIAIAVPYRSKSLVGKYWNAVNKFLVTNNISHLRPFRDVGVRDANGKRHVFETDPNILRRLDSVGELSFHTLYKNTAN